MKSDLNDNLKSALNYAQLGWRVYPVYGIGKDGRCLCKGSVADCKPGKHPWGKMVPHGGKDATTAADTLRTWFLGGGVNVGVRVDGFFVLDVEAKKGPDKPDGMKLLASWEQQHGPMPLTPTAESGGGGRHFYFLPHAAIGHPKEKITFAAGAELLVGGDVIAPPSSHHTGGRYRWIVPPDKKLAPMPDWLVKLICGYIAGESERKAKQHADADEPFDPMRGTIPACETFATLGKVQAGKRNDALNAVIGAMLGTGYTREQVLADGAKWAAEQEPPYSQSELENKVAFFARKQEAQVEELPSAEPLTTGCHSLATFANSQIRSSQAESELDCPPTPVEPSAGLPEAAYYGVVGEFLRAVEPLTEADPAGVLACVLTGAGNILGRQVHHQIGRRHSGNLFVLLVGDTSSRKGTCWDVAESLLSVARPEWAASCVENGFGSGQGFVYRIRDASESDEGVPDKRLLVVEEEWAKPLRLCRSENSILSPLIRAAFDGRPLAVMNRGENRYGCREPHVGIVGMITADELRELTKGRTEVVNGTINRFLLVNCERRRYLPTGGDYYAVGKRFASSLGKALDTARAIDNPLSLDSAAARLWHDEYRRLEQQRPGDYGKATARLSVHCLKLAMLYAALEGRREVGPPHLRAALAMVDYCDVSARAVFGKPTNGGEPVGPAAADPPHVRLLALIRGRADGITRTDAHRLFGNRRAAADLEADFGTLTNAGFVAEMGGRWYSADRFTGVGGGPEQLVSPEPCEPANLRTANRQPDTAALPETPNEALPGGIRNSPRGGRFDWIDDAEFDRRLKAVTAYRPAPPFDENAFQQWRAHHGFADDGFMRTLFVVYSAPSL